MLMDLNFKAIFYVFVSFIQHFQGFAWTSKRKSCPRTTDSLFYNMQAVMMWMCSHWLWMRNVYLFRINFAKVFRRIRIFAHKNISTFFLTGWYFLNQILVANKSYNFTNHFPKYQLYSNISFYCKYICNEFWKNTFSI